jgi:Fe(3+) dicitrate transport protein
LSIRFFAVSFLALPSQAQQTPAPPAPPAAQEERADEPPADVPEIIVTGTLEEVGVPVVPLSYPASRDVLGPQEVLRTGARDLNDLMQYLPAVSTRPYNGGDASAPSFSMRGMPDDGLTEYVLVMIDGVPANPMPYGWTAFSFFPLITEQVYAIDLIRGGQAVRYSPNNVAGALNLITAPIPKDETYELRSTFGSHGYMSNLLSVGNDDGRFGYLVTLGERHGDGYRHDGEFEYRTADVKLRWTYEDDDWLAWRIGYIENEHQAPGGLTRAQYGADRFANARPENHFNGFRAVTDVVRHVGDEREYVEYFAWAAQTRRNLHRQDPVFGAPTGIRVTDDDAYNANLGMRGSEILDGGGLEHDLYWGVRASQELIPDRTTVTEPIGAGAETKLADIDFKVSALSAHVDDTLRPTEDLTIVAGLRAEWVPTLEGKDHVTGEEQDDDAFELLPGASASYQFTDWSAVFANYQRSFRAPQAFGLDTTLADPDQDLDFESGESWEVGLRAESEVGVSGSVAAFRVDFDDVLFFNAAGLYENIGNIRTDGVDVVLAYDWGALSDKLAGLTIEGSVTWQDAEIVDAINPANDGNEVPYAWEEKAAWSVQYQTEDLWRYSLGGTYVGGSFSDEANTVIESANGDLGVNPSRTVWDAQVRREGQWGRAHARLAVGATNVFDDHWYVHSRGGFFGGGKVTGPPQQLYVSLQLSL